jgi:putative FmdB family regulatory protein
MPIYGYECNKCGHEFETLIRPSSKEPTCPSCESGDLTRQLSLIAAPAKGGSDAPACQPGGGCGSGSCGCPYLQS